MLPEFRHQSQLRCFSTSAACSLRYAKVAFLGQGLGVLGATKTMAKVTFRPARSQFRREDTPVNLSGFQGVRPLASTLNFLKGSACAYLFATAKQGRLTLDKLLRAVSDQIAGQDFLADDARLSAGLLKRVVSFFCLIFGCALTNHHRLMGLRSDL